MAWRREAAAVVCDKLGVLPVVAVEVGASRTWCHVGGALSDFWAGRHGGSGGAKGHTARCGPQALPIASAGLGELAICFVGQPSSPGERRAVLSEARRALADGGALLLLDHNRPRRLLGALGALVGWPAVPGRTALARWRRLAYPTAREAQAAGFSVVWMRLVAGERVQLVLARRRPASSAFGDARPEVRSAEAEVP